MTQNEALCVIRDEQGWKITGAFRNGSADSILAADVGNPAEYLALPECLRSACWPVSEPCVTLQTASLCVLRSAAQVRALAEWLLAASIAIEQCREVPDDQ